MFFMQTTNIPREYRVIKPYDSDKVAKNARKAFPPQTSRNVELRKFTRNAYPLRTCPKNLAQVQRTFFKAKKEKS